MIVATVNNLITDNIDIWTSAIQRKSSAGRGGGRRLELYGVKKLRSLILDLAVRGLLVPQDPSDEPACVLLAQITAERSALQKSDSLKKQKPLPEIIPQEAPHGLPKSWAIARFGQLAIIERGGSPRPIKSFITNDIDGLNWIKIGDTDIGGKYISSTQERITKDGLNKTRMVYPGDFLLTNSMSFGRPYITKIEGCIHDGWLRISPTKHIDKDYLYTLLSSPYIVKAFKASAAGAVVQNLNSDKVRETLILIPPLPEQQRIVAKVDELMALCDQLERQTECSFIAHQKLVQTLLSALTQAAVTQPDTLKSATDTPTPFTQAWNRLAEHFDTVFTTEDSIEQLKKTILQLAVMGKLVPQDPNDEPVSGLLKRIAAEKTELIRAKKIKKQKALPEMNDEDKPFDLPNGWEWVRVDAISTVAGGIQKTPKRSPINNTYPYLAVANVQRNSLRLDEISQFELQEGELEKYSLVPNDLLIVEGNGSESEIGRCAIWNGEIEHCVHQNHLIKCRPIAGGLSTWILTSLNSPFGITQMKSLAVTTSGLYNLSVSKIRNYCLPMPPIEEQHRIVIKANELIALCDQLKTHQKKAQDTQILLANVVTEGTITENLYSGHA